MRNQRIRAFCFALLLAALALTASGAGTWVPPIDPGGGACALDPRTGTYCEMECTVISEYLACFAFDEETCCWEGPNSCGQTALFCEDFCGPCNDSSGGF